MKTPDEVLAAVRDARSVVIATHIPMDGDGIGCGLALQRTLPQECVFVTEADVPRAYRFLPGADGIVRLEKDGLVPAGDLLLGLDAADPSRLGRVYAERPDGMRLLNIDHHVSNSGFGDVTWVDPDAAATGELVYLLLKDLGLEIDPVAAQCLLVSLVTDSGRFCYSATTARTLEIAAALVRLGAQPDALQRDLFGAVPLPVLRMQAGALERLQFHADGALALLAVPYDFGAPFGVPEDDVKDLIDLAISVKGVLVAALVRGLEEGGCKVSLRSKSDRADVAAFASDRGGGGHVRAAGFSLDEPPDTAAERLRTDLEALAVGANR